MRTGAAAGTSCANAQQEQAFAHYVDVSKQRPWRARAREVNAHMTALTSYALRQRLDRLAQHSRGK